MSTQANKMSVLFLVDGSGSFSIKTKKESPLSRTLHSVELLMKDIRKNPENTDIGYAELSLFGETKPVYEGTLLATSMHPAIMSDVVEKLRHGLNSGTDLAPSVTLIREMAKNASDINRPHVVLISDGDVNDAVESLKSYSELLRQNPTMTMNVIVTNDHTRETDFEKLAERLNDVSGRVTLTRCKPEQLDEAINAAAQQNMQRDSEEDALRKDLGKLRTHFFQALEQISAIETRLDRRKANTQDGQKPKPVKKRKRAIGLSV